MALLKDSNGNDFFGYLDQIGGQPITDPRPVSSLLGAANAEVLVHVSGHSVALFDLRTAAGNLTVVFEASVDGTNYFALPGIDVSTEQQLAAVVVTTTASRVMAVGCTGFRIVRSRISAYTSGNITVSGRASRADFAIYAKPIPSTLWVTATAAANTGVTLTLPAPGAGMFHYITSLNITRNATAALAGTATLVITTTNWPGSAAWSVGNAMNAGGTQIDLDLQPANPIKSSVANTATTVVCPVPGAAVLWRVNASYYVGA